METSSGGSRTRFAAVLLVASFFVGTITAGTVAFQPGVVIDETRARAYVMSFDQGVEAIDLLTGQTIWSVPIKAKPLGMHGSLLVVQQEVLGDDHLNLAFLEVDDAGDLVSTSRMPLPAKVKPLMAEQLGESFDVLAVTSNDELFITWQYQSRSRDGSFRGPGTALKLINLSGIFQIDTETGIASVQDDDSVLVQDPLTLPAGMNQLGSNGEPLRSIFKAGNVFFAFDPTRGDLAGRRTVRRWRAEDGRRLPDLTISDPRMSFKLVSANSPHFLASGVLEQASRGWDRFTWDLYNLETGAVVGQLRSHVAAAPFFITGNLIIHELQPTVHLEGQTYIETPRRLAAVNLANGVELWSRPLMDLRYRGVTPPGRAGRGGE